MHTATKLVKTRCKRVLLKLQNMRYGSATQAMLMANCTLFTHRFQSLPCQVNPLQKNLGCLWGHSAITFTFLEAIHILYRSNLPQQSLLQCIGDVTEQLTGEHLQSTHHITNTLVSDVVHLNKEKKMASLKPHSVPAGHVDCDKCI